MTTVAEIKRAVKRLPSSDYRKFSRWFTAESEKTWDREITRDSKAGKFDRLVEAALIEYRAGKSRKL